MSINANKPEPDSNSKAKNPRPRQRPSPPAMKTVDFTESYFPKEKDRIEIPLIEVTLIIQLGALNTYILGILKSRHIL
jgi:hypothetical protein